MDGGRFEESGRPGEGGFGHCFTVTENNSAKEQKAFKWSSGLDSSFYWTITRHLLFGPAVLGTVTGIKYIGLCIDNYF